MFRLERKLRREGHKYVAGIDEAGRGPLAGPVVAAAVILKKNKFENRIADSKLLTENTRRNAYEEIMEKAYVGVGLVRAKEIDRINILQATFLAMKLAVADLAIGPDYLLIDGTSSPEISCPRLAIVKGESHSISIACASIIAKVTRDMIMSYYDTLYPSYGFSKHKGYATFAHLRAIEKFGASPIHRRTFAPLKNL